MTTTRRGRVLRDTSSGEGLVFVEGTQYPFKLEGIWKSEFAPKLNMAVDADFDDGGRLVGLRSVAGQAVAGEQAAQAIAAAQESAKKMAAEFQAKGLPAIVELAKRVGYPILGAFAAIVIGWFFLPAISMNLGFLGKNSVTFYQGLKLINSSGFEALEAFAGGGSAGFYGFLCFVSLLAVFLPQIWKDRRASFGLAAPLVLMLLAAIIAYFKMSSQMAGQAASEMRSALSIGFGGWLALLGSAYLAWQAWRSSKAAV